MRTGQAGACKVQVGATLSIEGPMERHSRSTSLPITTARPASTSSIWVQTHTSGLSVRCVRRRRRATATSWSTPITSARWMTVNFATVIHVAAQKPKLVEAIIDGRLQGLRGIASIARAMGLSPAKPKRALKEGQVQCTWQVGGRWSAIKPTLKRDPALGGHDGV